MTSKQPVPPKKSTKIAYENNPFTIATNGISALFNLAKGVAIFLIVISILGAFSGTSSQSNTAVAPSSDSSQTNSKEELQKATDKVISDINAELAKISTEEWILFGAMAFVIVLAAILFGSLLQGVGAYTAARVSRGHKVSLKEAFRETLNRIWPFVWLNIIIGVKTLLWTLLFIIPGFVMSVRYSLAKVAFFDEKKPLRGNAAVKESLALTKGAWLTTFASQVLFSIITLGMLSRLVETAAQSVLYRQLSELTHNNELKPAAHPLSWFTLFLPFLLFVLLIGFVVIVALAAIALS